MASDERIWCNRFHQGLRRCVGGRCGCVWGWIGNKDWLLQRVFAIAMLLILGALIVISIVLISVGGFGLKVLVEQEILQGGFVILLFNFLRWLITIFSYSFNTMEMVVYAERWMDSHIISIDSESQKIKFVSAINDFYIEKNTPIIDRKIKNAGDEHVEYEIPTFVIEFFKNGKSLLRTYTPLGDGDYELIFNPKFEEFKNMIISIVDEYDKYLKKLQNGKGECKCGCRCKCH